MTRNRKVICYIATSADGYIARPDDDYSWLHRHASAPESYGYNEFIAGIDAVVWGRRTWDLVLDSMPEGAFGAGTRNYVFTSHPGTGKPAADVEFLNEPVQAFMDRMRAQGGRDIWMMGGAGIIGAFLDAGELDEFIIHVIPVFIGEGIPLIAPRHLEVPLELLATKRYDDGVILHHYRVKK